MKVLLLFSLLVVISYEYSFFLNDQRPLLPAFFGVSAGTASLSLSGSLVVLIKIANMKSLLDTLSTGILEHISKGIYI